MLKQFGAKPTKTDIAQYAQSNQWDGKRFVNLEKTEMGIDLHNLPKLLYKQFCEKKEREPNNKLPILPFNKEEFLAPSEGMKYIWYGHSVVLMRINSQTILIDPMLGENAAPISPIPVKRFSDNSLDPIGDFPDIDLLCLTHDHYDHLDYDSIVRLKPKVKRYFVALGVKRHLVKWGIDESLITELDWWQSEHLADIKITFTPTRHFSGRGLTDRAQSLWGGWAFKTADENIWFSGDGGYGTHFKDIGEKFGPFDFAFMECGQYNENWHQIHMYPEESVQAAMDAMAKRITPVHWAGFALAQHSWTDPVNRFVTACEKNNIEYLIPSIGQIIDLNSPIANTKWWEA